MSDFGSPPPPPPPPAYGGGAQSTAPPPNYLVWAILATILLGCTSLFALPLGIAGIVFSSQVNSKWAMGDVAGAQAASRKAKMFTIWTVIVGVVLNVIGFLYVVSTNSGI